MNTQEAKETLSRIAATLAATEFTPPVMITEKWWGNGGTLLVNGEELAAIRQQSNGKYYMMLYRPGEYVASKRHNETKGAFDIETIIAHALELIRSYLKKNETTRRINAARDAAAEVIEQAALPDDFSVELTPSWEARDGEYVPAIILEIKFYVDRLPAILAALEEAL